MTDPVREIVEWLESAARDDWDDPEIVIATFKARFRGVPLAALDEALSICEVRALLRDAPAGTA